VRLATELMEAAGGRLAARAGVRRKEGGEACWDLPWGTPAAGGVVTDRWVCWVPGQLRGAGPGVSHQHWSCE